jgi:hypothetical protein
VAVKSSTGNSFMVFTMVVDCATLEQLAVGRRYATSWLALVAGSVGA